jgi:hypothetical protein
MGQDYEEEELIGIDLQDVVEFVDAANTLAQSIESDIKAGDEISSRTVLALSKYIKTNQAMRPLLDAVQKDMLKLN